MSADNGIYVLVTSDEDHEEKQYRVVYASAIENIFDEDICMSQSFPGHSGCKQRAWWPNAQLNFEQVFRYFGSCEVFSSKRSAMAYARELKRAYVRDGGYLEYGVFVFDHSHVSIPFWELEMEQWDRDEVCRKSA